MQQLAAYQAGNPQLKPGLLILDSKAELVASVRDAAGAAARACDVVVLGPEGNACYDLLGGLRSLEDVETVTRRLLLAAPALGGDNAYWQTTTTSMLAAGLSLVVATQPFVTFDSTLQFLRAWFMGARSLPELVQEAAAKARRQVPPPVKGVIGGGGDQLQSALDQVQLWQ
jgi:hypothetical protein